MAFSAAFVLLILVFVVRVRVLGVLVVRMLLVVAWLWVAFMLVADLFVTFRILVDITTNRHAVMAVDDLNVVNNFYKLRVVDVAIHLLGRVDNYFFRAETVVALTLVTVHACNSFPTG